MTDAAGRWRLPAGWRWARAGELAAVVGGGTPETGEPGNFVAAGAGAVPWLTPADLAGHGEMYVRGGARYLSARGLQASAARLLPAGSVLFSSRAPIGRCAIAAAPLCTNQGFRSFVLRTPELVPEYLYLYLLGAGDYAHSLASGSTFKELSGSRAAAMWVPVAPRAEQARIVARVGAARARCARAGALLDEVPALLAALRRAIVEAGLRGELSAGWRAGQPAARGRPDAGLPGAWTRATVGEVARVQTGYAFRSSWYRAAGVRLLRGANLAPQRTRWDDVVHLDPEQAQAHARHSLAAGDLVIAMDRPLVAEGLKVCRISAADLPCLLVQRVGRLICGDRVVPEYLYMVLQGQAFRAHLEARATGTQVPHVSAADIAAAPLPLPPLAEQRVIARVIATRLARHAGAARVLAGLRGELAAVERAVLDRAFRGELGAPAAGERAGEEDGGSADQRRGRPGRGRASPG